MSKGITSVSLLLLTDIIAPEPVEPRALMPGALTSLGIPDKLFIRDPPISTSTSTLQPCVLNYIRVMDIDLTGLNINISFCFQIL